MADAIAGGAFQDHGVLYLSLPRRRLEHDILDAILHLHHLATKISHRGRKQHLLILAFRIERGSDLRKWFHAHQIAGTKIQRRMTITPRRRIASDRPPRTKFQVMRELVVNRDHESASEQESRHAVVLDVPEILAGLPPGQRVRGVYDFARLAEELPVALRQ